MSGLDLPDSELVKVVEVAGNNDGREAQFWEELPDFHNEIQEWINWVKPTLGRKLANDLRDKLSACSLEDAKQIVAFIRNELTLDILAREMPQCYSLRVIPPPSQVSQMNEIGSGHSARVFKVELDNELDVTTDVLSAEGIRRKTRTVAAKIFYRAIDPGPRKCVRILRETRMVKKVEHKFVVPCLGIMEFRDGKGRLKDIALVYPHFPRTLSAFSKDVSAVDNRVMRLRMLHNVASALAYLHEINIVHGDLRGVNILTDNEHAYLTDFGGAKDNFYGLSTDIRGGIRWIAQERIHVQAVAFTRPTKQSDVYEFGSTFLEIMTGQDPFAEIRGNDQEFAQALLKKRRESGRNYFPSKPLYFLDTFYEFLLECWADDPGHRPTAAELVLRMDGFLNWLGSGGPVGPAPRGPRNVSSVPPATTNPQLSQKARGISSWSLFRRNGNK